MSRPSDTEAAQSPSRIPTMPLLPPPDVVLQLASALPAGPGRSAVEVALRRFTSALAARWAGERMRLMAAEPRERAESGAVHIFRIVDSGWRFADDPDAMRALRRTLMPDGVGRALYRDWPAALAWMQAVVAALQAPSVAAIHSRHLGRMLQFFVDEVAEATRASPILPAGDDGRVIAAGRSLESALLEALAEQAAAGADLDRLIPGLEAGAESAARGGVQPVEPDAGSAPAQSPPPAEIEEVDE